MAASSDLSLLDALSATASAPNNAAPPKEADEEVTSHSETSYKSEGGFSVMFFSRAFSITKLTKQKTRAAITAFALSKLLLTTGTRASNYDQGAGGPTAETASDAPPA